MTVDEAVEALKPCPFCGEVPKLGDNGGAGGEFWSQINCESAKCEIQPYAQCFGKPDLAIKDWNTRAIDSDRATIAAQAELIGELVEALTRTSNALRECSGYPYGRIASVDALLAKAKEKKA